MDKVTGYRIEFLEENHAYYMIVAAKSKTTAAKKAARLMFPDSRITKVSGPYEVEPNRIAA